MPLSPDMNLELDLGFDSMERVELMAGLEQALNLKLPDDFGAEIFTVRDLINRLEQMTGAGVQNGAASRQSWSAILAEESKAGESEWRKQFADTPLAVFKYLCSRIVCYSIFRTLLRLEVRGLDRLPQEGPYLICPNHQSYLDAFVLISILPYRVFRKVFFVGYSVFFTNRFTKLLARLANIIPVDPDAHLLRAMRAGAVGLRRGRILCIFPEGGRSFGGELLEFKKGAAILSQELGVPMVPVGIRDTYLVWPKDSLRIRPHKVAVEFGRPIFPGKRSEPDPYQALTNILRSEVAKLIHGGQDV
jgi:long-chain acyl-CoA synthetase